LNDTLIASDPFASSLAGRKLGRYEVLARLASGGMAGVYVARAIGVAGFERLFAIKVLHPHLAHEEEFISMFLDEARLAARIRHPNVVPTIDISDTPDAGFYLVMEYIEGDHLGALLQRAWKLGKRMPFPVTLRILVDALEGLAAAHNLTDEAGRHLQLVHRDVSPHNIMVSTDGIARLTDFGVAKAEVRLSTTREGQFKGKLAYMAPEHASDGDADQRSDLFSMAIILWESLAGRRLFRAENHAATLNKICLEPIPLLSSADPGLAPFDDLLAKGLARDPNDRFQSAEEFAEAIEESAALLGGLAKAREVAQLVREYASEKISNDANLIRSAIAQLAMTGQAAEQLRVDQTPPVVEMRLQTPSTPFVAPQLAAVPEVEFADIGMEEERGSSSVDRRWLWAGLLVALAAAVGGTAAVLSRRPGPSMQPTIHGQRPEAVAPAAQQEPAEAAPTPSTPASGAPASGQPGQAEREHKPTEPGQEANHAPRDGSRRARPELEAPPPVPGVMPNRPVQMEPPTLTVQPIAPSPAPVPPPRRRPRDADTGRPASSPDELLPNPYH
jgi:serine/threonine-protein kinase